MSADNDLALAMEAIIAGHLAKGLTADEITASIMILLGNWTAKEPDDAAER